MKPNRIPGEGRADKIVYLKSLQYDILLKQKGGKFYLYIPELSLVGVGQDLNQAYQDLYAKKQDFFDKILECEAEDQVALPRKLGQSQYLANQLKTFVIKLLIVCILGGSTLIFGSVVIKNKIAGISAADIVQKIARSLVLEAKKATNISPEHQQKRIEKLRQFLDAFSPYLYEFERTFHLIQERRGVNNG